MFLGMTDLCLDDILVKKTGPIIQLALVGFMVGWQADNICMDGFKIFKVPVAQTI